MSDEQNSSAGDAEVCEGDILFECPYCAKSMAIEAAGAGLMVPCANCGRPVQVPIPDAATPEAPVGGKASAAYATEEDSQTVIRQLDSALAMANEQIDRLMSEKEALQERRAFLEQVRISNAERMDRITAELATVQKALARALEQLADARAEKPL